MSEARPPDADLRAALIDAVGDPFRCAVYATVADRPGVTVAQIATRLEESAVRVRRQIQRLLAKGLIERDADHARATDRGYRYRVPAVFDGAEEEWSDADRRAMSVLIARLLVADIARASRHKTYGVDPRYSCVRVPGAIDQQGWDEIAELLASTAELMESAMRRSARRLEENGEAGIEIVAGLLLFEASPWGAADPRQDRFRRQLWSDERLRPPPERAGGTEGSLPSEPDLRSAMIDVYGHPLRCAVYTSIVERPGVTISQLSARLEEPSRKVRHQVEQLMASGLVVVESETLRRNTRERHHRALLQVLVVDQDGEDWDDDRRRMIFEGSARMLVSDIVRAIRRQTFGMHPGHAEVRIAGAVDRTGWEELADLTESTLVEVEEAMRRGAARLEERGDEGIEIIAGLLLFESQAWEGEETGEGPRPQAWADDRLRPLPPRRAVSQSAPT